MDAIYEFIIKYWTEIFSVILLIVSFVLAVARKKPNEVIDTVKEKIVSYLPILIRQAEEKYGAGNGSKKLEFVISCLRGWLALNHLELTEYYEKIARQSIEDILGTPQRKEN